MIALVACALVGVQPALARDAAGGAETASHGKRHAKGSKQQLRQLRAMLEAQAAELQSLRSQVAGLQGQSGTPATPTGAAGGDLTGTYPNPTIAPNAVGGAEITDGSLLPADFNPLNVDGAAGTPSLRSLGAGAQQAAAGNDPRLSDSRTPTGAAGGDLAGTYPNPTIGSGVVDSAALGATIIRQPGLTTLNAGETGNSDADCNPGETLLGGGFSFTSPTAAGNAFVLDSIPIDLDTWQVTVVVDPASPVSASFRARAVCLQ